MEFVRPRHLDDDRWTAIELHARRCSEQLPGDHGGTVGACKDLVECTAKTVLEVAPMPDVSEFPTLVKKAATVLGGAAPRTDGHAQASTLAKGLSLYLGATETAAQGLGELRNSWGSGHGRTALPVLAAEDVALVEAYTEAWVRWALARLERLLSNSVSALINELRSETFVRGLLRQRFEQIDLEHQGEEEQQRLGVAVANRGGRSETFVVADDGLAPLVYESDWPLPYQHGVVEGLLLTPGGMLGPIRPDVLTAVMPRLPEANQERLVEDVEAALPSPAALENSDETWDRLRRVERALVERLRPRWRLVVDQFIPF